ncbi:hypothetical protein QL285_057479 [Trifolium repens]|nr:hypothetical protein QL285_057479 [Trifolium repens]
MKSWVLHRRKQHRKETQRQTKCFQTSDEIQISTGNSTGNILSTVGAELNHGGAEGNAAHLTTTLLIYIAQRGLDYRRKQISRGS